MQYLDAISKMTAWSLFISKANHSVSQWSRSDVQSKGQLEAEGGENQLASPYWLAFLPASPRCLSSPQQLKFIPTATSSFPVSVHSPRTILISVPQQYQPASAYSSGFWAPVLCGSTSSPWDTSRGWLVPSHQRSGIQLFHASSPSFLILRATKFSLVF